MKSPSTVRSAASAILALCGISGCGYRFIAGTSPLPEGIRSVAAPVFANRTSEPGLELVFTEAMRQQLIRSGVAARGAADAEIQGEVLSIGGTVPSVFTITGVLATYYTDVSARFRLVKGSRSISEVVLSTREDYLPGKDILESEANRAAALRRVADQLARDAYDRLATGWASAH